MTVAPVGEWESPITSELITASSISLGAPRLSPDGAYVYYLEGRPTEKGRQVLCRQCAPLQHHAPIECAVAVAKEDQVVYLVKHRVIVYQVQGTTVPLCTRYTAGQLKHALCMAGCVAAACQNQKGAG